MGKDLVVFQKEELQGGIVRVHDGHPMIIRPDDVIHVIAELKSSDVIDFVRLSNDITIMAVSDVPIENVEMLFGDGAEFISPKEIPVSAESWALPLSMPAILNRSINADDDQAFYALDACAQYLEKNARGDQTAPWRRGLIAATIRAHWNKYKERGLISGESHWGWIKTHFFSDNGDEGWHSVKGKFECWMRCADVFLRNVENRSWIAELTLSEIIEIPISRALICCGAIGDGLFEFSDKMKEALLNPTTRNQDMRHLVAAIKGHRDEVPERVVNEETGEVLYFDAETKEVIENPQTFLDEYLPDFAVTREWDAPPKTDGVFWTFDWERKTFGYWRNTEWIPGLAAINMDDLEIKRFVDRIIGRCGVAADYDGE